MIPLPAMGSGGKAKAGAAQLALSPRPTEGFHRGQKDGQQTRSRTGRRRPNIHQDNRRPKIGKHRKDQDV